MQPFMTFIEQSICKFYPSLAWEKGYKVPGYGHFPVSPLKLVSRTTIVAITTLIVRSLLLNPQAPPQGIWALPGPSVFLQTLRWCHRLLYMTITIRWNLSQSHSQPCNLSYKRRRQVFMYSWHLWNLLLALVSKIWSKSPHVKYLMQAIILPFFNDLIGFIGAIGFWPLTVYFPVVRLGTEFPHRKPISF